MPLKLFYSFRKSVSRDVRTDYNLDLSFFCEKENFNGGFVVGTQEDSNFRGYTRTLLSQGTQKTNKS